MPDQPARQVTVTVGEATMTLYVRIPLLEVRRESNYNGFYRHGLIVLFELSWQPDGDDPENDRLLCADRLVGEVDWSVNSEFGNRWGDRPQLAAVLAELADVVALERGLVGSSIAGVPLPSPPVPGGDPHQVYDALEDTASGELS